MAKVVKGVVSVIGAVASVLAVIPSPIQPIAAVVATVASVASTALNMIAPTKPKSSAQGQQTSFKLDPQSGIPYVIGRTLTGGNGVHRDTWGTDNQYQGFAIVWSGGGPVQAIEAFQADQTTIGFGAGYNAVGGFKDFMWLSTQLGACPSPALPTPVAGFPGWGAQSKLSGYAAGVWVTKFDKKGKKYSGGLPRPAAIIQGVKVYDPRQDSTYPGGVGPCRPLQEETYVYSENPWLHALTWALGRWQNGVKVMGVGMLLEQIAVASFVDAANIADANNWKAGGVVSSVDDKWEVMKMLAQAGGGQCIRLGALLTALVEAPRVAVATIRESDLVGKASISATQFQRSRINRLVPIYRSEAHGWEQVPADPVSFAVHEAEDGGRRTAETEFVLVQQIKQAAELAGYEIKNSREFGPIDLELKIQWLGIEPGDLVNLDMPSAGLANQPALALTRGIDPGTGNVALSLRSETPTKHAEALGKTTTIAPSPSLVPPDLSIVAAPTVGSWTLAAGIVEGPDGTGLPILVARGATDNPNASHVVFEYRPVVAPQGAMPPAPAIGDIAADSTGAEFVYEAGGWARRWLMQSTQDAGVTLQEFGAVTPQTSYQIAVSYVSRGVLGDRRVLGPVLTGSLVASGFAGAGDLAGVDYVRFGDGTIRTGGGGTATDSGYQTALGTAAAIAGQGPGATAPGSDVLNNRVENNIVRIRQPLGGTLSNNNSNVPGAIRIQLPVNEPPGLDSMIRFCVDVFEYVDNRMQTYEIAGYNWPATGNWLATSARMIGGSGAARPVRFGRSGGKWAIWIGDAANTWQYPAAVIRDVQISYNNLSIDVWDDGWVMSFDTAAATNVSAVVSNPNAGDAVFGGNVLESWGGAVATTANFRTNLGTAAAIAGQGAFATLNNIGYGSGYITSFPAAIDPSNMLGGSITSGWLYDSSSGALIRDRWPAEFGANVTESRTAAAIAGQGAFATLNTAAWNSGLITNRPPIVSAEAVTADEFTRDGSVWQVSQSYFYNAGDHWYIRCPENVGLSPIGSFENATVIDPNATYEAYWDLLEEGAGAPVARFYTVVCAFDAAGNVIGQDGTFWFYPSSYVELPNRGSYYKHTARFGKGTARPFPANAVKFSVGVLMNYNGAAVVTRARRMWARKMEAEALAINGNAAHWTLADGRAVRNFGGFGWGISLAYGKSPIVGPQSVYGEPVTAAAMIGLSQNVPTSYASLAAAFYYADLASGTIQIYEDGNFRAEFLGYTNPSDVRLRIDYDGVNFLYYLNGTLVRTSFAGPGRSFRAAVDIYTETAGYRAIQHQPGRSASVIGGNNSAGSLLTSGALVTSEGIAASIAGQGALATRNTARIGAELVDENGSYVAPEFIRNNANNGFTGRVAYPAGGAWAFEGALTGAIQIVLPATIAQGFHTMVKFEVDIYDYNVGTSVTYVIGGYPYPAGPHWINCTAKVIGSSAGARPVRFGRTGGSGGDKFCIWIGDAGGAWGYPKVQVRNFMAGYASFDIANWQSGWAIGSAGGYAAVDAIEANPTASDAVFGVNALEGWGGAVATLPNFKTGLGTAAAIAGQADWATYSGISTGNMAGRVSRLDSGAGRALDGRLLNSNNNFGLRALSAPPGMSATAQTSTATVDFNSSGILYPDWGGTLSLPSASFPGLSQSTQYYFWRNMPSPDGIGSSYGYSTNLVDALGTGKVYLGQYFTPAAGGGGGGGGGWGGENCVAADAIVRLADGRLVDAAEVKAGDRITVLASSFDGIAEHVVSANLVADADCVRLVTESMIPLTLALNTPMTTKDRGWIIAANASGYEIPVLDAAGFRWEKVLDVEYVGRRPVARIECENGTYAAGDIGGRFILSHNPIYKP